MKGIVMTRKGDELIVKIDLSKTHGPSKSGKTTIVATTEGNVPVEGSPEIKIGINAFKQ